MKKIILSAMMLSITGLALAQGSTTAAGTRQGQATTTTTTTTSTSSAANQGNNQTITVAPVTTNIASDLRDQGATAAATSAAAAERIAAINAAAALEIARIQADTGSRDLSADARAALDREAAIEIARINSEQTIKNTPSVSGPQLTSSNDTCMGSTSGSVNVAGFGAGLGTTWTDQNCKMLKNSRELWNMGMKAAALALMCTDASNREALELTGFKCPTRKPEQQVVQGNGERYTDPIVRSRLGLPPLN